MEKVLTKVHYQETDVYEGQYKAKKGNKDNALTQKLFVTLVLKDLGE